MSHPTNPQEFFAFCKENNVEQVDLKFCDMFAAWQHCTYPLDEVDGLAVARITDGVNADLKTGFHGLLRQLLVETVVATAHSAMARHVLVVV